MSSKCLEKSVPGAASRGRCTRSGGGNVDPNMLNTDSFQTNYQDKISFIVFKINVLTCSITVALFKIVFSSTLWVIVDRENGTLCCKILTPPLEERREDGLEIRMGPKLFLYNFCSSINTGCCFSIFVVDFPILFVSLSLSLVVLVRITELICFL